MAIYHYVDIIGEFSLLLFFNNIYDHEKYYPGEPGIIYIPAGMYRVGAIYVDFLLPGSLVGFAQPDT